MILEIRKDFLEEYLSKAILNNETSKSMPRKEHLCLEDGEFIFVDKDRGKSIPLSDMKLDKNGLTTYELLMKQLGQEFGEGGYLTVMNGDKLVNVKKLTRDNARSLRYDRIRDVWEDGMLTIPMIKLVYFFLGPQTLA
jgi:hypothetical protein